MPDPGRIVAGGIVLFDEPAHVNVTTFEANGDVMLVFNARPGADFGQVFIGLSAAQAIELVRRLELNLDHSRRAVAEGRGGATFEDAGGE